MRYGQGVGDIGGRNIPTVVAQQAGTLLTLSGLINITNAGEYTFQIAEDDQSQLIIDGIVVAGVNTATTGGLKAVSLSALGTGKINLQFSTLRPKPGVPGTQINAPATFNVPRYQNRPRLRWSWMRRSPARSCR